MNKLKITFVTFGQEQLSISLLSAIAKQNGHNVTLAYSASLFNDHLMPRSGLLSKFFDDSQNVFDIIKKNQPDVVAFSALSSSYGQLLEVAKYCKKEIPLAKTIFGGVHPSAAPEYVIKEEAIDYIVIGEGEEAFKIILDRISEKDFSSPIPNTWFKDSNNNIIKGNQLPFFSDLNKLPQFDKSIWEPYLNQSIIYSTMASRGCPFNCSFCFNKHYKLIPGKDAGNYIRLRSPSHLMTELISAKQKYNIQYVDFVDDIFTMDKKWLKEFLILYKKEINKPFHCFVHASFFDEETAQLLSEGGCKWVQIGVQSNDEDYKKNVMHRKETNQQLSELLSIMKKYNLLTKFDYMFGSPGEPLNSHKEALDFFRHNTPNILVSHWTTFFPSTEMTERAYKEGLINKEIYQSIYEAIISIGYRNQINKRDEKTEQTLNNYKFVLVCYTILPYFIRKRIGLKFATYFPNALKNFLHLLIVLLISIRHKEPRIKSLIFNTFKQMFRIIKMKFK